MLKHDLAALSDPAKDQYFLTNPAKLQHILDAADIRETDSVVEVGAGAGTVARVLPKCATLTLVEMDSRLIPALRRNAPGYASIRNADGVALLGSGQLQADVILANLPSDVASEFAALLPNLRFRVAILTAGHAGVSVGTAKGFECSVLASITGDDFTPPQPGISYLVSVRDRRYNGGAA